MQPGWLFGRAGQRRDPLRDQLDGLPRLGVNSVDKREQAFFGIEGRPVVRAVVGHLERADPEWPLAAKAVRARCVHAREPAAELLGAIRAEAALVDPLD